ncbi:MAG: hypothetical protein RLZZ436_2564 [Planctomycetota bacterium]|jgi:multidrug resistance efflux pump
MDSPIISTLPAGYQMDRQYGLIYDRVPARTDDLTQISGLHPREAAHLNTQGVFCFGQIALWRHREQVRFAEVLQIPFSRIVDEGWVSQARDLCRQRSATFSFFPSGMFRTLVTLVSAFLIGVLLVWILASRQHAPLAGILIADVTSVKMPANVVVQSVHVRPGDEVFTGQKLLTVENSSLLSARTRQQQVVRDAERVVQRLEARALLEQESHRAGLAAATMRVQQELLRQRGNRSLARGNAGGGSGMLFFSGSSKLAPAPAAATGLSGISQAATPQGGAFRNASEAAAERPSGILAAVSPIAMGTPGRKSAEPAGRGSAAVADGAEGEGLRAELTRLESLQQELTQHVAAAIGLTQARESLREATEELQRLQAEQAELQIAAPAYGLVGTVDASVGDQLKSGNTIVRILHLDRRSVVVQLPGQRLPELSVGETVEINFPGARGYQGRVASISPMTKAAGSSTETRIAVRIEPTGRVWPTVPVGCDVQVFSWK